MNPLSNTCLNTTKDEMRILSFITKWLTPKPVYNSRVSGNAIRELLDFPTVRLLDRHYNSVSIDSFIRYAKFDTISNEKYVAELHDCDDYAFKFFVAARKWAPGIPVGIVLGHTTAGMPHAWNCFVDVKNKRLLFFEPQEDILFEPTTENIWEIII